jgi:hypothetical protein
MANDLSRGLPRELHGKVQWKRRFFWQARWARIEWEWASGKCRLIRDPSPSAPAPGLKRSASSAAPSSHPPPKDPSTLVSALTVSEPSLSRAIAVGENQTRGVWRQSGSQESRGESFECRPMPSELFVGMLRQVIPSGATVSRSGRMRRHPKIGIPAPEKNDLEIADRGILKWGPSASLRRSPRRPRQSTTTVRKCAMTSR